MTVPTAIDRKAEPNPLRVDLARKVLLRLQAEDAKPGQRLSVPELAGIFGVSRTPMTGALEILVELGVLRPAKSRGLEVALALDGVQIDALLPNSPLEAVYQRIMRDRATGDLPQEVSEAELMPRYDVTRGTIRKLLMRFAAEGLVRRQPGHGWRFSDSLDDDDAYRESYEIRLIVECGALASPRFQIDPERLASIRRAHEGILGNMAQSADGDAWFGVNAEFHEGLASFSRNRFALEIVRQQNHLRRMQEAAAFTDLPRERIIQSCHEHLAILDSVEAGDRDWAGALLRRHLMAASEFRWPL